MRSEGLLDLCVYACVCGMCVCVRGVCVCEHLARFIVPRPHPHNSPFPILWVGSGDETNRGVVCFKESVPMILLHQTSLSGPKPRENPSAYTENSDKVTYLLLRSGKRQPTQHIVGLLYMLSY